MVIVGVTAKMEAPEGIEDVSEKLPYVVIVLVDSFPERKCLAQHDEQYYSIEEQCRKTFVTYT
jgi:hypothetical protein